ncbi:MAG: hypothetical protein P8126_10070 [Gammaproteobacteria bacterium]
MLIFAACPGVLRAAFADDGGEADNQNRAVSRNAQHDDRGAVRLEPQMQARAGIRTVRLHRTTVVHEIRATGRVIDIKSLVDQRSHYFQVEAQKKSADAALGYSRMRVKRLHELHSMESNISARELQQAELQRDKAAIQAASLKREMASVRDGLIQEWGPVLTGWALGEGHSPLDALLDLKQVLVLVQPAGSDFPETGGPVYVNREDERGGARKADYVSAATRAGENRRGDTFYYRTAAADLRSDMNLYVWVPQPTKQISGYVLPRSAVVWFNGSPWYYVKKAPDSFVKQPAGDHVEVAQGWLLNNTDLSGEEVVVQGAQLLLSEEFRRQIPSEEDEGDTD